MKLILVRHGETQLNRDGRIQGIDGAPLNETGRAQALAIAEALSRDLPFQLYTSPVARALETAQVISDVDQVPLTPVNGLEEVDVGELTGLPGREMRQRYPEFMKQWARDSGIAQFPGGESLLQVQNRAWGVITELMDKHTGDTVVAVSHHFTIKTIICKVLEIPLHNSLRLQQELGSITRSEASQDKGTLVSLNETWHLWSIAQAKDGPIIG